MATRRPSTFEQRNLLHRLEIELDQPWVWVSTDGPVSRGTPARFRLNDGETVLDFPLTDAELDRWDGYRYEMLGLRIDLRFTKMLSEMWGWNGGPISYWGDLYVDMRYQCVRHGRSPLSAEHTIAKYGAPDAAIRGAMLKHSKLDRANAWKGMDLLLKGPTRGRPQGPTRGSDAAYWLARVAALGGDEVGEPLARAEYYAQVPRGPARYDWWDDNVLRTIRRRKHRQNS